MTLQLKAKIASANQEVVRRMIESQPSWVDVQKAGDVVPRMRSTLILHAGPPIPWDQMCWPQRNAICGAVVYEGLARTAGDAAEMVRVGEIALAPCHEHQAVGSMCGVTSYSMPVLVVRNETFGNLAFCHLYEHPGREKLSYGTYNDRVHANLKWLEEVLGPILQAAIRARGGMDVRSLISRALTMGDECHSRNSASTALFIADLAPQLAECGIERSLLRQVLEFLQQSTQFALHLIMAACKASADAASGVPYGTVVTAIARNGVETGIRLSGLDGRWFTGPAGQISGLYFSGYDAEDGTPDLGDSAVTETVGLGAFAHAASPALALVKSPTASTALDFTEGMRVISVGENSHFSIPYLNGRGSPVGIDARLVVRTRTAPVIDTAVAEKRGGGQIGVGNAYAPLEAFHKAIRAFADRYDEPTVNR
jgi:hypothetical protein